MRRYKSRRRFLQELTMTRPSITLDRRDVFAAAVGTLLLPEFSHAASSTQAADAVDPEFAAHAHDWKWLIGSWSVRHRRLKDRLAGSTEWEEFTGTCVNWPLMGGRGNVDDNVLDFPSGRYQGVGVRAFDIETKQWSIWWIDSRRPGIEPPVRGGFANGTGTFIGDDTWKGKPVKVRFRWTQITPTSAHWDQASSGDGGKTWETNWHMDFTRTA
jgi:hypothetical protein